MTYLEIGDRLPEDGGGYPRDDLAFQFAADGSISLTRKDATPL